MLTTIRYTFAQLRAQVLGWGLGIAILGLILVPGYDLFSEQQGEFLQMIESYPPEFLAFFGEDVSTISTPKGYLGMYGFSMLPIIIGIFALMAGSGLFASDEESGRLDLIVAHPVGRTRLFWGRVSALVAATLAILTLGWLGFCVLLGGSSLSLSWGEMALPFLPVLAPIYATLALLFSMLLPARRLATMGAGVVMVASCLLSSLASMNENLATIAQLLPYEYFQGGDAIDSLNVGWLMGLLAVSAPFALLAAWRFHRRDIRIGGEGGWRLPWLSS